MVVLVTGCAGFIGYHVAAHLLDRGDSVVGVDNLNNYYDVRLKQARLDRLQGHTRFDFKKLDVSNRVSMSTLFAGKRFDGVVHLAAQAGVRYSIDHPHDYVDTNLVGFLNVLEGCRHQRTAHLVFASSSSVYGANRSQPFSEHDVVAHPVSLYAATKKSNELMAHSYADLYGLPVTGLRFFTVYGPWGRPDMALFLFTRAMLEGRPIKVFNHGEMKRDFTYIDDIVEGVVRVLDSPPRTDPEWSPLEPDPATSAAPYRIFNIGSGRPVPLMRFIEILENKLEIDAQKELLPMQPGDIQESYCDVRDLERYVGYKPSTKIEEGVGAFVDWYRSFYDSLSH